MDSNRMMLALFALAALDLLGALEAKTTPEERRKYSDWIYGCQRCDGGFRGSPLSDFGSDGNDANSVWDPSSVPATYFALCSLLILRDDLSRLKQKDCRRWLKKMQRGDGSFGQTLGDGGQIEGGFDTRFGYTAMGIRWILRASSKYDIEEDVDVEALAAKISTLQVCYALMLT
jgi:geranylgeranyl transferase type-1 subunit beta